MPPGQAQDARFYLRTIDDLERRDGLVATPKLASARDVEAPAASAGNATLRHGIVSRTNLSRDLPVYPI